jgi:hypothetical protein
LNIGQGGVDTLVFSGVANDFTVTGFTMGTGANRDVLDFSGIDGLNNPNGDVASTSVYANTATDITGLVVALAAFPTANDATTLEALFNFSVEAQTVNDFLAEDSKMIFLAPSGPSKVNTSVWLWNDQSTGGGGGDSDGSVDASELTLLATLNGLNGASLSSLRDDNVHYNPI